MEQQELEKRRLKEEKKKRKQQMAEEMKMSKDPKEAAEQAKLITQKKVQEKIEKGCKEIEHSVIAKKKKLEMLRKLEEQEIAMEA